MTLNAAFLDGTGYVSSDGTEWILASASTPLPVSTAGGGAVAYTDASGTVGTSSATALAANSARKVLVLQNVSANNNFAFTIDGTAAGINTAGSMMLTPGQGYMPAVPPSGQINVIGSAAGTAYTLKWA